jgi:hypothetical protein
MHPHKVKATAQACTLLQPCVSHSASCRTRRAAQKRHTPTQLLRHPLMYTVVHSDCHPPAPCDSQKPRAPTKGRACHYATPKKQTKTGQCSCSTHSMQECWETHAHITSWQQQQPPKQAASKTCCQQVSGGQAVSICVGVSCQLETQLENERATAIERRSSSAISMCGLEMAGRSDKECITA